MDIYLTASQFGKYPGLATSTSVNNCYIYYGDKDSAPSKIDVIIEVDRSVTIHITIDAMQVLQKQCV